MELYAIKVNGFANPLGIRMDQVVVTWKVRGAQGREQVAAWVEVFGEDYDEDDPASPLARVDDADSLGTLVPVELAPCTRYRVRVTVRTDKGEQAMGRASFETGKMLSAWEARWIAPQEQEEQDETFHPEFVREIPVHGELARARLYVCGLGLFEAWLDDEKVGTDKLAPFLNDYQEHVQACTYDVTDLLRDHRLLRVFLGKGWWMGRFGLTGHAFGERHYALIAEVRLWYEDGTTEVVGTDDSWRYRRSPWRLTDIYDGEAQDWAAYRSTCQAGEEGLVPAREIPAPARLCDRYSLPLRGQEAFAVREVVRTPKGETVLDFGQNMAGYVTCSQALPAGARLTLEFGEVLQDGCFYHDNYRTARSVFSYVSDGQARQVEPHFTFFGFRYVKLTCDVPVDPACLVAHALYSALDRTGWWESGNSKVNRLHQNALWGLRSNFVDLPMDCPQRDERLGWTGDAQAFCRTAGYLVDTRPFYDKFMRDLRTDQVRNGGKVAIYLPNEFPGMTGAAWSDIATLLPHMAWLYGGSRAQLARHYPLMRDWVDCVHAADVARGQRDLWDFGFQFGDWLALDGATEQSIFGRTDSGYVASAFYYASARYTAEVAGVLGLTDDEARFSALAGRILAAIRREYFTPTGRLAVDTQTGYLLALRFGLAPDEERMKADLRARIKRDLRHIKGGFVGATSMNTVLADHGMADLAYDFLLYEGYPGWLYAVNLGATTIWERWNSLLPDGSISGTGMNSLNHYAYGSVVEFLYRHAAGIQPLAPGFRRARLAPQPHVALGHVDCRYDSAAGEWESSWRIRPDGSIGFHFVVPFGCTAQVVLPERESFDVAAGTWDYVVRPHRDYLAPYGADTPAEVLLKDERAVQAVEDVLPGALTSISADDVEALSKSLADMRLRAAIFRQPTDKYDEAIAAVCAIEGTPR